MLDVMNTLFLEAEDADWSQRPTSQFGVYVSTTSMTYIWIKENVLIESIMNRRQ